MNPKYEIGQKVTVRLTSQIVSARDSTLQQYVDKIGEIANYYWISPRAGEIFYIYAVRFPELNNKEIILHEDEIKSTIDSKAFRRSRQF